MQSLRVEQADAPHLLLRYWNQDRRTIFYITFNIALGTLIYLPCLLRPFNVKGGRVESTERLTRDLQNHTSIFLLLHAFFSSQTLNPLVLQFNFIHANILGGVGYSLWLLVTCSDSFPTALNGTSTAKTACYFAQVTCVMYCLTHSGGWRRLGERIFLLVRKINYMGGDLYSLLTLRQENLRYLIS